MSAQTLSLPARRNLATPLLMLGGALWIATFGLIVINGTLTGTLPNLPDDQSPLFLRLGIRLFSLAVPVLGAGLLALRSRVHNRGRRWTHAATVLIAIACTMATINLVTLSGLLGTPHYSDTFGGLSTFITSIAALLMAVAVRRNGQFPSIVFGSLLFVGLTTIPVLFGTPLPIGPDWATDFLAFLTSGSAFIIAGNALRNV